MSCRRAKRAVSPIDAELAALSQAMRRACDEMDEGSFREASRRHDDVMRLRLQIERRELFGIPKDAPEWLAW